MANAQNLLNAAKKQKANGGTSQPAPRQASTSQRMMENVMAASTDLGSLENLYFNPEEENISLDEAYEVYPNGQKHKLYDAHDEMEQIKSGQFNVNQKIAAKMPQAILESILSNPLDMPTDHVESDGEIMDEALQNRTMDILDKLEARDRKAKPGQQQRYQQQQQPVYQQPINESYNQGNEIDYNVLAKLIDGIIDKKFAQYKQVLLNESRNAGQNAPKVSFIKLGDTFTFMDDSNSVYECKMVYKGKGRVKQN